jgi:hypothetical protein
MEKCWSEERAKKATEEKTSDDTSYLPVVRLLTWAAITIPRYPAMINVTAPATRAITVRMVLVQNPRRTRRSPEKRMTHPSIYLYFLERNVVGPSLMTTPIVATLLRASSAGSPPLSSPCLATPVLIPSGTRLRVWSWMGGGDVVVSTQALIAGAMAGAGSCERQREEEGERGGRERERDERECERERSEKRESKRAVARLVHKQIHRATSSRKAITTRTPRYEHAMEEAYRVGPPCGDALHLDITFTLGRVAIVSDKRPSTHRPVIWMSVPVISHCEKTTMNEWMERFNECHKALPTPDLLVTGLRIEYVPIG